MIDAATDGGDARFPGDLRVAALKAADRQGIAVKQADMGALKPYAQAVDLDFPAPVTHT